MSWVIETRGGAERRCTHFDDQIVDHVGHDRIEAGGRLVEEDDLGLARRWRGRGRRASACRPTARPGTARRLRGRGRPAPSFSIAISLRLGARHAVGPGSGRRRHSPRRAANRTARRPGTACRTCASRGRASAPRMPIVSSPSTLIEPASGCSRPRMHFSSTDLPVPEPPMTTSDLAGAHVEVDAVAAPASAPKRLRDAAQRDLGRPCVASSGEERFGDEVVGGQDQDRGRDHGVGGRRADALRAALANDSRGSSPSARSMKPNTAALTRPETRPSDCRKSMVFCR